LVKPGSGPARTRAAWRLTVIALLVVPGVLLAADYPQVRQGASLQFPRDQGSHPDFRNEWWYVTGWLKDDKGAEFGVQITFFRNRPGIAEEIASRFAPRQLLFAHAAVSDPAQGRLLHGQRAARAGFGLAQCAEGRTDVAIDDWRLRQTESGYEAAVATGEFSYALRLRARGVPLLQGDRGFSRKGPESKQASFYYSQPHLAVSGMLVIDGRRHEVSGEAWLDHEWSSEPLAAGAVGWDWVGVNLIDGGALMAFRIRTKEGRTLWAGGAVRGADSRVRRLAPSEVRFSTLRRWRSPRTAVEYPVSVRLEAGSLNLELAPLMDDQEFDARASTGTVYWEGAVRAMRGDSLAGRGYLELTGYGEPLRL
jgi:predicted secreted hydrolase